MHMSEHFLEMEGRRRESALRDFGEALSAFSDDPSRHNLVRYLMASRALEQARGKAPRRRIAVARLEQPKRAA